MVFKKLATNNRRLTSNIGHADNDVRYVPNDRPLSFCGLAHESRYKWLLSSYDLAGKSVLDFGCGSGYGTCMLAQRAKVAHGVDFSRKAIEFAKIHYTGENVRFFQMDASCSDHVFKALKPNSYDIIISFDVIEHLERYFDYLENICRLVKEDGFLAIGCPNRLETFNWNRYWNKFHIQEFSPYQLRKILSLYFGDVILIAQDFQDESKREIARKANLGEDKRKFEPFGKFLGEISKSISKRILPNVKLAKACELEYFDISFLSEPGDEILRRAFGLIAVCKRLTEKLQGKLISEKIYRGGKSI